MTYTLNDMARCKLRRVLWSIAFSISSWVNYVPYRQLFRACLLLFLVVTHAQADDPPAWMKAEWQTPMYAGETREFMRELVQYVMDHHLKKDEKSQQRGMIYEYSDVRRSGEFDQFVQGEALDTMHDGAWFAAALVNAARATGDEYYMDFLRRWTLPFYLKMLNNSDTLFSAKRNDARPTAPAWGKEWALQEGEKGFVPYYWDDRGSVSLERRRDKNPLAIAPSRDNLAGQPNPRFLLDGYSQGSSNHLAQDLGVMLETAWLLFKDSNRPEDKQLTRDLAEAAMNLQRCRMNHHGHIPMSDAPAGLAKGDAELMKHVPSQDSAALWKPDNHYARGMLVSKPGQRQALPGFSDDQQYRYYAGIAKHGGKLPRPLAFRTVYDAFTEPMLYRYYSDDAPVPAGINRFDLHGIYMKDGKLEDYRSERKGPAKMARPVGSRMGPQNMICCGWAIQLLREDPAIWESRYQSQFGDDLRVYVDDPVNNEASSTATFEPMPDRVFSLSDVKLSLRGTRSALRLSGECGGDRCTIKVFSEPDAKGSHASIELARGKAVEAVNDRGDKLVAAGTIDAKGDGFQFAIEIPYTVVKGQQSWMNGIEQGRYSVQVGDATRNFYLASPTEHVLKRLEHELAGGLRTWQAIFREKGYLPSGMGTNQDFDHFSDSGAYAHLLSAASQWLLCLEGKRDWEMHRVPDVANARK